MLDELYLYPVQLEPNKSPLRNRLLVLLLWECGHLSSPSRSCLGRLILICSRQGALQAKLPHTKKVTICFLYENAEEGVKKLKLITPRHSQTFKLE